MWMQRPCSSHGHFCHERRQQPWWPSKAQIVLLWARSLSLLSHPISVSFSGPCDLALPACYGAKVQDGTKPRSKWNMLFKHLNFFCTPFPTGNTLDPQLFLSVSICSVEQVWKPYTLGHACLTGRGALCTMVNSCSFTKPSPQSSEVSSMPAAS